MTESAGEQVVALATELEAALSGTVYEERVRAIRARGEGPLRTAHAAASRHARHHPLCRRA